MVLQQPIDERGGVLQIPPALVGLVAEDGELPGPLAAVELEVQHRRAGAIEPPHVGDHVARAHVIPALEVHCPVRVNLAVTNGAHAGVMDLEGVGPEVEVVRRLDDDPVGDRANLRLVRVQQITRGVEAPCPRSAEVPAAGAIAVERRLEQRKHQRGVRRRRVVLGRMRRRVLWRVMRGPRRRSRHAPGRGPQRRSFEVDFVGGVGYGDLSQRNSLASGTVAAGRRRFRGIRGKSPAAEVRLD